MLHNFCRRAKIILVQVKKKISLVVQVPRMIMMVNNKKIITLTLRFSRKEYFRAIKEISDIA